MYVCTQYTEHMVYADEVHRYPATRQEYLGAFGNILSTSRQCSVRILEPVSLIYQRQASILTNPRVVEAYVSMTCVSEILRTDQLMGGLVQDEVNALADWQKAVFPSAGP